MGEGNFHDMVGVDDYSFKTNLSFVIMVLSVRVKILIHNPNTLQGK